MTRQIQIGVIGGREVTDEILGLAYDVGKIIAERRAVLVCGGLGGVMEAACRGAKEVGGTTVGILPGTSAEDANPFVDIAIPTGLGVARNAVIIQACDGVIAVGGRYGTLSEMGFALQEGLPLVSLKSWHVDETVIQAESAFEATDRLFSQLKHDARG
jgi:uncharacterized protein (TIGR00725 family)